MGRPSTITYMLEDTSDGSTSAPASIRAGRVQDLAARPDITALRGAWVGRSGSTVWVAHSESGSDVVSNLDDTNGSIKYSEGDLKDAQGAGAEEPWTYPIYQWTEV